MDSTNRVLLHHHFLSDWRKQNDPISVIVSRISQSLSTKLLAGFRLRLTRTYHLRCGGNVQIRPLHWTQTGTVPTWMKTRALAPQTRNKSTSQVPFLRRLQGTKHVKIKIKPKKYVALVNTLTVYQFCPHKATRKLVQIRKSRPKHISICVT